MGREGDSHSKYPRFSSSTARRQQLDEVASMLRASAPFGHLSPPGVLGRRPDTVRLSQLAVIRWQQYRGLGLVDEEEVPSVLVSLERF